MNKERIDSQSNKHKSNVMESKLVLGNDCRSNGRENDEEIGPRSWRIRNISVWMVIKMITMMVIVDLAKVDIQNIVDREEK